MYDLVVGFIADLKQLGAGRAIQRGLMGAISTLVGFGAGTVGNFVDDLLEGASEGGGPIGVVVGGAAGVSLSVAFSGIQAAANETNNIAGGYSRTYEPSGKKFLDIIGKALPATANRLKHDCGTELF